MSYPRFKPTKKNMLTPRPCPTCKRMMSKEFLEQKHKLKGQHVSEAFALAQSRGEPIGRPRSADYMEIYKLRDKGLSLKQIADQLNVSRGSVQHALRVK